MSVVERLTRWSASLGVVRRFLPELRPEARALAGLTLLSLGGVALDLVRPWPLKWIVDAALEPTGDYDLEPGRAILFGALAMAVIAVARAWVQFARDLGLGRTELQVTRQLRYRTFSHLSELSPRFHARHKSGDLLVRLMGDIPMVSGMLVSSLIELTTKGLFILGTVWVMVSMDPVLTGFTFVVAPVILGLVKVLTRRIHTAVRKQRRKEGALADYLHEAIAATETIQATGSSAEVVRRFARNNRRSARAGLKARRLSAGLTAGVESLLGVGLATVFAVGSQRVLDGQLSTGDLLVFASYVRTLSKPVRSTSKHAGKLAKGTACGERLLTILDERPEVTDGPDAGPAPVAPGSLVFEDVSFRYAEGEPALDGFSASFRRGQLSALVGRSGAGKSTVAALALRLMDPDQGRVLLDGEPLDRFTLESLRARVGLCLQRTLLFGETIRDNLLLVAPEAEEQDLWQALDQAGVRDVVAALPDGLDTELGSQGSGLSGGQLNRLSLARTLLRRTDVLIVDEPFAGLDRLAAARLGETLAALARDAVVVVIAHDFESLDAYDHVVFLEQGRLQGTGTHAELSARLPLYRSVVRTSGGVTSA